MIDVMLLWFGVFATSQGYEHPGWRYAVLSSLGFVSLLWFVMRMKDRE